MKIPRKQWKYWCTSDSIFWRDFKEKPPAVKEHYLYAYVVKKAKTARIAGVSVRQGLSHLPSLADRRRGCSPEGTRIIPRERYVSLLCPQISENLKIGRFFVYTGSYFIHTGSELFDAIDCTKDSFSLDPKYSYQILFCSYRILFLFIPDPNLQYRS